MSTLDSKTNLQPFLDRLISHTCLNETEQRTILSLPSQVLEVSGKRDLVGLDRAVDHVSVVVKGIVGRFGQNAEGAREITALHLPGDAPDLHTVVLPGDTVPLEALTDTTIVRVAHTHLRAVAAAYPAIAEAFWRHCSIDAAITATWIKVGRRDAKTHIAHLFCEVAVRQGVAADGKVKVTWPITQTQLGDVTGLTPVHVNRSLKGLEAEGCLTVSRRSASIPDWARLVARAEFDDSYLQNGLKTGERLRIVD